MAIPQDVIDRGILTVYLDTPKELEEDVKVYNRIMDENKSKMRLLREIEDGFLILNPIVVVTVFATSLFNNTFLGRPVMTALLILSAAVYVIFGIYKRYLFTVAIANLPILPLNWMPVAVLIVANVVFLIWYYKMCEPLKRIRGYPDFRVISIVYKKGKEPKGNDERK